MLILPSLSVRSFVATQSSCPDHSVCDVHMEKDKHHRREFQNPLGKWGHGRLYLDFIYTISVRKLASEMNISQYCKRECKSYFLFWIFKNTSWCTFIKFQSSSTSVAESINSSVSSTNYSTSNSFTPSQSVSWLLKWKQASMLKDNISLFWIFKNTSWCTSIKFQSNSTAVAIYSSVSYCLFLFMIVIEVRILYSYSKYWSLKYYYQATGILYRLL